jgi:hypothetical protein
MQMFLPNPRTQDTKEIQHVSNISHQGKVILIGVDDKGTIWYTVKQDGFETNYGQGKTALIGWEDWRLLELPGKYADRADQPQEDVSVIEKEKVEFRINGADEFLMGSLYNTHQKTAVVPVQLISHGEHLYVFRQSTDAKLLVDRFVLDGLTNQLNPKIEVRFKRSGLRYRSQEKSTTRNTAATNPQGSMMLVDSLDFTDSQGLKFYEPTLELSCVGKLYQGWFAVAITPTIEADVYRWHIVTCDAQGQTYLTTLRASKEGLFELKNYITWNAETRQSWEIEGIIRHHISLGAVKITGGPTLTKYDLLKEKQIKAGEDILVRDAMRLMLLVVTDKGIAAISFGLLGDGTLSLIKDHKSKVETLQSRIRTLFLPPNTLDDIQSTALAAELPKGDISSIEKSATHTVKVTTSKSSLLTDRSLIRLSNTVTYDGKYQITNVIDKNTFEIETTWNGDSQMGAWEVLPDPAMG